MSKNRINKRRMLFVAAAIGAMLALPAGAASAANLTWDANALGNGQVDGGGAWLAANQWWTGLSNTTWTSGDNATFGLGGAGGAVTLAGPTTVGSLTMNAFTGTYTLGSAGQAVTLNAGGITVNSGAGATTIVSPVTLGAAQSWTNNSGGLLTVGTGAVTNGGNLLTVGGTGNTTIAGALGGAGGLAKTGAGVLTLSDTNTFTGATTVTGGTLEIGGSGRLGGGTYAGPITINPGATFKYNSSADQTFSSGGTGGVIRGGGSFVKDGAGTLTVSEDSGPDPSGNLYTGQITINQGTLKMVGDYAFFNNACTYSIASGAVLDLDCSDVTYPATGTTGTTINGAGTVRMSSPVAGGEFWDYYKTAIVKFALGSGGLIDLQANVTMWGYAYFDWTNNRARLNVDGGFDLYRGPSVFADALTGAGTVTRTNNGTGNTLTVGVADGSGTFSGTITGTYPLNFTKTGSGTQTLTGLNTYTGATLVSAGTLAVSGAGHINTTSGITVNGPTAAFMQNSSVASTRTFTLTQGTLGGTGTISTAITIGPNVTLAPGDRTLVAPAKGVLTITNAVNLAGGTTGGTTEMRLFSTAANDSDVLVQSTTGGLTYGGILKVVAVGSLAFAAGNNWDLFDFDSQSGSFSNNSEFGTVGGTYLPLLSIGKKWSFDYGTGVLSVVLSILPGDTNGDWVVDAADFITLKKNFGQSANSGPSYGDFNNSGATDWNDLQILMGAMGGGAGAGQSPTVPEPATLGLLAMGAMAVARRRKK